MNCIVRFFLDSFEIDEPVGWDTLTFSVQRDDVSHGVGFETSLNSLQFYGQARDYILVQKTNLGLRAKITFTAYEESIQGERTDIVVGTLNMGKFTEHCGTECYVSAPIDSNSCSLTLVNRFDQQVDLDKNTSQNGINALPQYANLGITIDLPAKQIDYLSEGFVLDTDEPTTISGFPFAIRPDYGNIIASNFNQTELTGASILSVDGSGDLSPQVLWDERLENFPNPIIANGRLKGTIHIAAFTPDADSEIRIFFANGTFTAGTVDGDFIDDILLESYSAGTPIPDSSFDFDFTLDPYTWLPVDDGTNGLYFYLAIGLADPGGVTVTFDPETYFRLETTKVAKTTKAQVYAIHEALSRLVENITDSCCRVKSSYYGRTDSEPFAFSDDGCGGLRVITSGLKLRNAAPPLNTFFTNPKSILSSLQDIDNIGWGIEDDIIEGRFVLRVEDLDFFYQQFEIIQCLGINLLDSEVQEDKDIAIIKIGYKYWETQANFGLDEYNSNREYHTDLPTINNTLDLTAEIVAGEYAIEITRQQTLAEANNADTTYDDKSFIFCMKRGGYGLIVEQGGIDNPQNIFNPDSCYNYRITPVHNLMKWYRSLVNAYPNITDSKNRLYFSSGTGNIFASGQLIAGTYGYSVDPCKLEGVDIRENSDVFLTQFLDGRKATPLWMNETVTFVYPMSAKDYNRIKAKKYGYITYQCGNGRREKGWIKEIQYTPGKGEAQFVLIKQWNPEILPPFVPFPPPQIPPVTPPPSNTDLILQYNSSSYPVDDPLSVSDWNTFFGMDVNATQPFNNVTIDESTSTVTLFGAIGMYIKDSAFQGTSGLVRILDPNGAVAVVGYNCFNTCTSLIEVNLPLCGIVHENGFLNANALQTATLPKVTRVEASSFGVDTSLTDIDLGSCTNLGGTTGDNFVFELISGNNIVLTIPAATVTDGDVVYLQAHNTVTLILT